MRVWSQQKCQACRFRFDFRKSRMFWHISLGCIFGRRDVFLSIETGSGKSICYLSDPFMLQSSDDTDSHRHTITSVRHTHSHTSQCGVGVRQHNQWHWQSGQVSYPGGANLVQCLNINVKWLKLEFRARQVKQSEAQSEGCTMLLLLTTTVIGLSIDGKIWHTLDLDCQVTSNMCINWPGPL